MGLKKVQVLSSKSKFVMVGAIHSMYVYMYNTQVKFCLGVLKIMYILAQLNMSDSVKGQHKTEIG